MNPPCNSRAAPARPGCCAALCMAALAGWLSGCAPLYTASGTGALLKADQRAIIVTQRTDPAAAATVTTHWAQTQAPAPGGAASAPSTSAKGVAQSAKNNDPHENTEDAAQGKAVIVKGSSTTVTTQPVSRYVTCAEPSPDVMTSVAAQLAANGSAKSGTGKEASAGIQAAIQQAVAFIGMRTPSIQLLRDAMYRVCEAYANGAIDNGQYELLMRRYQRYIVAMMAIEQLTQAGRVPPITLAGSGGVNGERPLSEWTDEIKRQKDLLGKQDDKLVAANKDKDEAETALKKSADDQDAQKKLNTAKAAIVTANTESAKIKAIVAALEQRMVGGTALAGLTAAQIGQAGGGDHQITQEVAWVVEKLASKVLDTDDTGALCFEQLKHSSPYSAALNDMCTAYMKATGAANNALAASNAALAGYYDQCIKSKDKQACLKNAPALAPRPPVGVLFSSPIIPARQ